VSVCTASFGFDAEIATMEIGSPISAATRGSDSPPRAAPAPTLLDSVWLSIVTPGAGSGLILAVNASLALLLAVLGYFVFAGLADAHIFTLAALALGLLGAFNWFIAALDGVKKEKAS
jgi:hypothetical protein